MPKFGQKVPYLGIFELEFQKLLSNLKSAFLNLSTCKILRKNKYLNLGPKVPYLDIFGLQFQKTVVIFVISTIKFL